MIPVIPVEDVGKRVKELGTDLAQFAEVLEMGQPVATYFQDVDQTPTNPRLNVIIQHPAQSKWQDVHSHYHSANLVLLLHLLASTLSLRRQPYPRAAIC